MDRLTSACDDAARQEERALLLQAVRQTLNTPHGYAVILHLLTEARTLEPYAAPSEHALRDIFHNLFRDIEEADPSAALRLFAHCRGIPQCPGSP